MKTRVHFLSYLAWFFLEFDKVQTKVAEKIKTQAFMFCNLFSKIVSFIR